MSQKSFTAPAPCDHERNELSAAVLRLHETVAALRHPETGCPWDLAQDHRSLRPYMLEEAYEAVEAMGGDDSAELRDELGDVLLQVILNAQIATERQAFTLADVVESLRTKLVRRHPHVFGSAEERARREVDQIAEKWQEIKQQEQQEAASMDDQQVPSALIDRRRVKKQLPASLQAVEIGKQTARLGFDWHSPGEVWKQFLDESREVAEELGSTAPLPGDSRHEALVAELGDLYFTLAQVCRHLKLNPELVAQQGNHKFLDRFARLEALAHASGLDASTLSQEKLEALWQLAKREESR